MSVIVTILTTSLRMILRPSSTVDILLKRKPKPYEGVIVGITNFILIYFFRGSWHDLYRNRVSVLLIVTIFNAGCIVISLLSKKKGLRILAYLYAMFLLLLAAHLYVFLAGLGTFFSVLAALTVGLWFIGLADRFSFFRWQNGKYRIQWKLFGMKEPHKKRKK